MNLVTQSLARGVLGLFLATAASSAPDPGAAPPSDPAASARINPTAALAPDPAGLAASGVHYHTNSSGLETAPCTCRPATDEERRDPSLSPDGWIQAEPRASFNRGFVPLPLVPDWVGTRIRATGGLAWGDADDDGDLDLAVGTYYANQWPPLADYYNFIYLNNGGMLEANPSWISSDERHTCDVDWGDLNGDGYPDLFAANGGSSFHPSQVFYGRNSLLPTTAGWSSSVSCWAIDADMADFDLDHDLDVATANEGNSSDPYRPTYVFRNTGTGLETTPFWHSNQVGITNSVDWGDMNGDGRPDLAVAGWVNWQSGVFLNLGSTLDPAFAWTTGHPERTDKGIGWSDVDLDNHADLLVGGNGAPDWLFHNEGTILGALPIWASGESYHGCEKLEWVDIDRDGDQDLATIHFSTGHVRIYLNNAGVLSTMADWQYDAASGGTALAFGDIDNDGFPDLAIGTANGPIELFLNTGTPAGLPETSADLPRVGALRLSIAPNPSRGPVHLLLESSDPVSIEHVEVWDVSGRQVVSLRPGDRSLTAGRTSGKTLSLSWSPDVSGANLPAGIYYLRTTARAPGGNLRTASQRIVRVAT
jgi:hypothetical protein